MFIKSDLPPDHELFEQVDDINRSIARVRSFLSENVGLGSIEDMPMLRTEVEIFFQAHLRRALAFLEGWKYAADAGHGIALQEGSRPCDQPRRLLPSSIK
jgi:hypothetical protein